MYPTIEQMAMTEAIERARQLRAQEEAAEQRRLQEEHAALLLLASPRNSPS
jgi:hypothetical protein